MLVHRQKGGSRRRLRGRVCSQRGLLWAAPWASQPFPSSHLTHPFLLGSDGSDQDPRQLCVEGRSQQGICHWVVVWVSHPLWASCARFPKCVFVSALFECKTLGKRRVGREQSCAGVRGVAVNASGAPGSRSGPCC